MRGTRNSPECIKRKKRRTILCQQIDKKISENIKKYRKIRHVNLMQIAAYLGLSHQQFYKYEVGQSKISAATLLLLSHKLQVPLMNFFKFESQVEVDAQKTS